MKMNKFLLVASALIIALPMVAQATSCGTFASTNGRYSSTDQYKIKVHGMNVGTTTNELSVRGGQYQFSSVTDTKFMFFKDKITEKSSGSFSGGYFYPNKYSVGDTKKNHPIGIVFNRAKNTADITVSGKSQIVTTNKEVLDNVSYLLNLRADLIAGKKTYVYSVLAQNKEHVSKVLSFKFLKQDGGTLNLKGSTYKHTVMLSRKDDATGVTDKFWFDPAKQYTMVQSEVVKGGKVIALATITKVEQGGSCS